MPIVPSLLERLALLRFNLGPGPLLDLNGALAFRAVSVALRLGVFEALRDGPLTAAAAAGRLGADERGLTVLLEALAALGYVVRRDGCFVNTPMTADWMLHGAPGDVSDLFLYFDDVLERWGYLEETIRRGSPPCMAWEWMDRKEGGWKRYHAALRGIARVMAPEIVKRVNLPAGARRLLDIGGSHGFYSVAFCRRHPGLAAEVFDWAQARGSAEETIAAGGMAGRVAFREGNIFNDELEGGYDAALLFNFIRIFPPERNRELVAKVAGLLNPGGILAVLDEFGCGLSTPAARGGARLKYLELFNSTPGRNYGPAEVIGWADQAGLRDARLVPLRRAPGLGLVLARKGA